MKSKKSMTADLMAEVNAARGEKSIITVMGVGGAGGNAVNHMWNMGIQGVTFMVCNTDRQAPAATPRRAAAWPSSRSTKFGRRSRRPARG